MSKKIKKIGIVGAGLSGLSCAAELVSKGHDVSVFDKSTSAGGRVQTDVIDGFVLDHGFQVYLTSYPTGRKVFNYINLDLKKFGVGALLKSGERKFSCFSDPLRNPFLIFKTLTSGSSTFKDKILILKMKFKSLSLMKKEEKIARSSLAFLKDYGFSDLVIANFFKPFFSGVFLEEHLETPSHYFLYLFDKFSKGRASLPAKGMNGLIKDLLLKMPEMKIILGKNVTSYEKNVIFLDEEKFEFDHVVIASPILNKKTPLKYNAVTTYYFKTRSRAAKSKYLYLCNEFKKNINHIACMSAISSEYSPNGWELFSVNVLGESIIDVKDILLELEDWFGFDEISTWEFIKKYEIKKALPKYSSFGSLEIKKNGLYFCGDYMESPSIEGALSSGLKVAELIFKEE